MGEAMRPPFSAPSKRPGPSAGTGKPKFMDHVSKNALLATCASPYADKTTSYDTLLDSEDAIGLFKFIIEAADLVSGGLAAGSITGFRIRGRPSDGTEKFKNFQAGLKATSLSEPDETDAAFSAHDSDQFTTSGDLTLNNEDSWTELTLNAPFIWDGSKNIEIALFHATGGDGTQKTASYSYANTGL